MINALILAGDRSYDGMPKALIKIAGRYMIEYIIQSLRESGCVSKIYVTGQEVVGEKIGHLVDGYIKSYGDIIDNVRTGISHMGEAFTSCIICTCDIPLVKGEAIRDFVEKCSFQKLDLGYPIINKELNDKRYPEVQRTYVKLREGVYTGGNIIYINPKVVEKCTEKAEKLVKYRKNPFKMGKVLGFTFLIRLAAGKLSISSIEKKIQSMLHIKGNAIICDYPEIGNDVDKPSDIEFINKYIKETA